MIDVMITISGPVGSGKSIIKNIIQEIFKKRELEVVDYNVENNRETFAVRGDMKYGTTLNIIPNCTSGHNFAIIQKTDKYYTTFCNQCGLALTQDFPNAKT